MFISQFTHIITLIIDGVIVIYISAVEIVAGIDCRWRPFLTGQDHQMESCINWLDCQTPVYTL